MVSNTTDDLPDPETPVKIVIWRFGMRSVTSLRLFSRAPRISMYSVMGPPWVGLGGPPFCLGIRTRGVRYGTQRSRRAGMVAR